MGVYPPPAPPPPNLTDFQPKARIILDISRANPCVVTTVGDHEYNAGNIIRINIPYPGSMSQINGQFGLATILSADTFSLPIDTRNYQPFTISLTQDAQCIPIAEVTATLINAENNAA